MRNTELLSKHPKRKKRRESALDMSDGEVSGKFEEQVARSIDLKRILSSESDSSLERVKKHKKKRKKHRRRRKHSESDLEENSEAESHTKESESPEVIEQNLEQTRSNDREDKERSKRNFEEDRRRDRSREDFQEAYELARLQEPVYEDSRARHYDVPSRPRHSDNRQHRERSEADHHSSKRHHRRDGPHPRHERGKTSSSSTRYHDDRPSYRERRHSEEHEQHNQSASGRSGQGGRQGSRNQWRDEEDPKFNPSQSIKQERTSPHEEKPEPQTFEWGKKADNVKVEKTAPGEKEKPNFGLSGKLTEETNMFNGVVIKYSEPPEARKPRRRWRFYPFKGEKALQTLYIHRQSSYLLGRDRKIADIPIDHPSCSKQHAALQYRLVNFERENGTAGKRVRPYIIDLESANGTFVNNKKIDAKKYVELLEKDVVKFGFSSREYVLLHEHSKDDDYEDVGDLDAPEGGEPVAQPEDAH